MNQAGAAPENGTFSSLGEALIYAERCRTEGRLMEAESVCRKIIEARPNSPEAEHLLGIIAHQSGKIGEAIEHIQQAVKLAPQVAIYHANLGEMCRLAGRVDDAIAAGRRALALNPNYAGALSKSWHRPV
jgi:Flp pilus assembly protein TadD